MSTRTGPRVSVVVPVYDNSDTLIELTNRVRNVLSGMLEQLIFVNDACPAGSDQVLRVLATEDRRVSVVELAVNRGQQAAVFEGLRRATGDWVVVMDADLQDPPEAIPSLLAAAGDPYAASFAGRRGRYESVVRLMSGWGYRWLMAKIKGLPIDAGGFVVLSRAMVDRVLALQQLLAKHPPVLGAAIGASGLPVTSVPVVRQCRPRGGSRYSWRLRTRTAWHGVSWALAFRLAAGLAVSSVAPPSHDQAQALERHNEIQRRYFGREIKSTMIPASSRYVERQLDQLLDSVDVRPAERVLEVGCGMGRYTLSLHDRGLAVEGLDLSSYLLGHLARAAAGRAIPLHCADVVEPPADLLGQFDAVIALFALHHMHDIPACLASMARLLRPGGRIAFCEPNPYNPLYYVQMAARPGMTWEGDGGIVNIRRRPVSNALSAAGFTDIFWRRFGFFPPTLANGPLGRLEPSLESFRLWQPVLPFQLFGGRLPVSRQR